MTEPKYVQIADKYAREILDGSIRAGLRLPSFADMARENDVSEIVIRQAVEQLNRRGLVRTLARKGTVVLSQDASRRIAPERQVESPETTFGTETGGAAHVEREVEEVGATAELAEMFGIDIDAPVVHVLTRASDGDTPISISDTYHLPGKGASDAAFLVELLAEKAPPKHHAVWLGISTGEPAQTVKQEFLDGQNQALMISEVTYPPGRYREFSFRMALPSGG